MYEAKCLVMDYPHHVTQQHHQAPQHHIHQLHQLTTPDTTQSRWTQYQQLWRQHHMFNNFNNNNGIVGSGAPTGPLSRQFIGSDRCLAALASPALGAIPSSKMLT
ncbi:unnamed protein product [Bemisia tabaci]|uniref:Uncharacterized protein n=1 Tax=Bemisia tabaci TaxID=7038 RepID=A0A9P0F5P3_BEMTA|nr:unnamed protein product [Bemisia tabaci]